METGIEQKPGRPTSKRVLRIAAPAVLLILIFSSAPLFLRTTEPRLNPLPLVRQSTPYTCGVASLESILQYYGQEWREDNLARELKSNPEKGTDYHEIIRFAQSRGLRALPAENMTVDDLRRAAAAKRPVMVAFQAWGDKAGSYAEDWEDGHYAIVAGVDDINVYFMDPSTLGNYTFIPIPEFEARWHDAYTGSGGTEVKLVHFGITFDAPSQAPYNPKAILPLK
jgi:predicted double-glycine peptidase